MHASAIDTSLRNGGGYRSGLTHHRRITASESTRGNRPPAPIDPRTEEYIALARRTRQQLYGQNRRLA